MKANLEATSNGRLPAEHPGVARREVLKTTALAAVGCGAGLGATRSFAQVAGSSSYKPSTSNYLQVHKELVVIDGCTNLTGLDKDPQYLDWCKQGGATHDNAQLLKMSGPRDPYQAGGLGVVKPGAYADLLLVDGNPLENLDLVADPGKNFVVIMKDGKIYKNTVK